MQNNSSFESAGGRLSAGVNYWASHAGTNMWRDWRPDVVEKDFSVLAGYGTTVVRVFPLWPDFQPVSALRSAAGDLRGYGTGEEKILAPDSDGMDPEMLDRFQVMADLAEKYHLKLIVGLLTGWMSGRLFVPPVLDRLNLFTDPEALRWEGRFIRRFIGRFKSHPAIVAWEPGNECNCLSRLDDKAGEAASWHWLDFIVSSIRAADPSRPVYSGMHGCRRPDPNGNWNLFLQGELCDGLTTHPYPLFTPHCGKSALNTLPAVLHSTAETLLYRGISGKPAFVEEIGTLGPGMLSKARTAAYLRTALLSAWVHDCRAFLWWCAFDQDHLDHAPYRWQALERELGLFRADRQPHPAGVELKRTVEWLNALPFDRLPPRRVDAAVILSHNQEKWKTAYGSFLLAKQAGFEVEFTSNRRPEIPEASFYWLPAVNASDALDKEYYRKLREKVQDGASLLVTDIGRGILQPFAEFFGCEIDYTALKPETVRFTDTGSGTEIQFTREVTRKLIAGSSEVLIQDDGGSPLLTVNRFGKGRVFYLNCAPELSVLDEAEPRWYRIYSRIGRMAGLELPDKPPEIGRTIHKSPDGTSAEILLNYADHEAGGLAANSIVIRTGKGEFFFPG